MMEIGTAASLGITQASDLNTQERANPSELGQKDFLRLMTAQLQNQDPFAPMENGEFIAQMAQFSTVDGLENINQTLDDISGQIAGNRISTGSSLLGQHVLVPGTTARADDAGEIHGVVDLADAASEITISYTDAETGSVLHSEELGAHPAGLMGFSWTSVPAELRDSRGAIRISVTAESAGEVTSMPTSVYAKVTGVEMPADGTDINLRIEDYGIRNSLEISQLR